MMITSCTIPNVWSALQSHGPQDPKESKSNQSKNRRRPWLSPTQRTWAEPPTKEMLLHLSVPLGCKTTDRLGDIILHTSTLQTQPLENAVAHPSPSCLHGYHCSGNLSVSFSCFFSTQMSDWVSFSLCVCSFPISLLSSVSGLPQVPSTLPFPWWILVPF